MDGEWLGRKLQFFRGAKTAPGSPLPVSMWKHTLALRS